LFHLRIGCGGGLLNSFWRKKMGREVRRVPQDWNPPKDKPHFDKSYAEAVAKWKDGYENWKVNPESDCEYWEWAGNPPDEEYYRPAWSDEERTHYMMYETTTEGTPISPAFETPEKLARWLADTKASAFGGMSASYEHWLRVCNGGYACSAVFDSHGLRSGVEGLS
jgi:hypothetical protein